MQNEAGEYVDLYIPRYLVHYYGISWQFSIHSIIHNPCNCLICPLSPNALSQLWPKNCVQYKVSLLNIHTMLPLTSNHLTPGNAARQTGSWEPRTTRPFRWTERTYFTSLNDFCSNERNPICDAHSTCQINLAEVDESTGRMTGGYKTYAICGAIRR